MIIINQRHAQQKLTYVPRDIYHTQDAHKPARPLLLTAAGCCTFLSSINGDVHPKPTVCSSQQLVFRYCLFVCIGPLSAVVCMRQVRMPTNPQRVRAAASAAAGTAFSVTNAIVNKGLHILERSSNE